VKAVILAPASPFIAAAGFPVPDALHVGFVVGGSVGGRVSSASFSGCIKRGAPAMGTFGLHCELAVRIFFDE
jgi:hypothetical protein